MANVGLKAMSPIKFDQDHQRQYALSTLNPSPITAAYSQQHDPDFNDFVQPSN
jgi:hypothetical protein